MARFEIGDPRINRDGAPTMQTQVEQWFAEHPTGSISQCAKELGICRQTASKWQPAAQKLKQITTEQQRLDERKRKNSKFRRIINILKE